MLISSLIAIILCERFREFLLFQFRNAELSKTHNVVIQFVTNLLNASDDTFDR